MKGVGSFRPFYDFYQGKQFHITGLSHLESGFPTTQPDAVQAGIEHLVDKIETHQAELERNEEYRLDDAEIAIITFGSPGRAARAAIYEARAKGIKVGMFRLVTFGRSRPRRFARWWIGSRRSSFPK